ncbi:MAG: hypothetical protein SBU_000785 [Candidatus Syntrophoarchaeum butanivorans]|uniref:Uncharacterized protein n=1 Tax=Candidatus Syntropharchaeum butanivorans TaxID=1839936 RepID=A0A1F2P4Z2_9EURY|nr:MAG: hypothetical protein SBU_000785 [Candidatus Syntrophoarchaeum butanivorans]
MAEKISSGEMKEDEFWFVALEFAKVVVEKARGMFKTKSMTTTSWNIIENFDLHPPHTGQNLNQTLS